MLVNGQTCEHIAVDDRGLAYGDGLFETIRVHRQQLLFGDAHLARLARGAAILGIPCELDSIRLWLDTALASEPSDGVLKLVLTRGSGGRGYRPADTPQPRCVISRHPLPALPQQLLEQGGGGFVCRQRLAHQPSLAGIKHLNRLEQVLASREFADHHAVFEGLMADHGDCLVEGTRSNVFVSLDGRWLTPELSRCGILGVMRAYLLERFAGRLQVADIPLKDLSRADEVFVANSVFGVVPLTRLDLAGAVVETPVGPFARAAMASFREVLEA